MSVSVNYYSTTTSCKLRRNIIKKLLIALLLVTQQAHCMGLVIPPITSALRLTFSTSSLDLLDEIMSDNPSLEKVEELLKNGADPNVHDNATSSPRTTIYQLSLFKKADKKLPKDLRKRILCLCENRRKDLYILLASGTIKTMSIPAEFHSLFHSLE